MKTIQHTEKKARTLTTSWGKLVLNNDGQAQVEPDQLAILLTVPGFSEVKADAKADAKAKAEADAKARADAKADAKAEADAKAKAKADAKVQARVEADAKKESVADEIPALSEGIQTPAV